VKYEPTHPEATAASTGDCFDVVILGAGLAGLSLARHLLMTTEKRVLLLDKNRQLPSPRQKVGESSVQVAGYYYAKVLGLEEYLWRNHFMKYNLRFNWKTPGRTNRDFEDYGQSYIRGLSNIACYQLDRNTFEAELLRLNRENPRFRLAAGVEGLDVRLAEGGEAPHLVTFRLDGRDYSVESRWVVDTTGRGRFLARRMGLSESSPINHGSSILWVDGLVDIEKLTESSPREIRLNKARASLGHLPIWAATNHFMGEGYWFWVIPLQGKTSLGLVYDHRTVRHADVCSADKLLRWVCETFPLFARDLPHRKVIDYTCYKEYAYGCAQTIHPGRWALSGMSGRFTDPLYSPGSDFIALHNTMIVDAIVTQDAALLERKCRNHEALMNALYSSLLPTFSTSYNALGDQEVFTLKYTWELSVYFAFFVFPFINDLSTDLGFVPAYLRRFARLGAVNHRLQSFLSGYFQWLSRNPRPPREPLYHDFTSLEPLRRAEALFYKVGVSASEATRLIDEQLDSLEELARFIVTYVHSAVLDDPKLLTSRALVEGIDFRTLTFDPDSIRENHGRLREGVGGWEWTFCTRAMDQFRPETPAYEVDANPLAEVQP
jgi:flavin-dependent dehydrogenase